MSDPLLSATAEAARDTALDAVWREWRALGAPLAGGKAGAARSIVDPEALVLLSLALRERERRLDDVLGWWAGAGATLLSVQRMATLAGTFPVPVREDLRAFAWTAVAAGDRRWSRMKAEGASEGIVHRRKGGREIQLESEPALVLKLRAGFGVGVKADLLAILIGAAGAPMTIRALAAASSYTLPAVRSAAQEMVQAKIVRDTAERPAAYFVNARGWLDLFYPGRRAEASLFPWRHWAQVFAFLAAVLEWARAAEEAPASAYVLSSRARDVYERHQVVFTYSRVAPPDLESHRGPDFLPAFSTAVEALAAWMKESV